MITKYDHSYQSSVPAIIGQWKALPDPYITKEFRKHDQRAWEGVELSDK